MAAVASGYLNTPLTAGIPKPSQQCQAFGNLLHGTVLRALVARLAVITVSSPESRQARTE